MSFFNVGGFHSPPSRPLILPSPTSPFCTSPSQLQEVTLDQDVTFSNSMGLRSPGGPMRGRSVKEFEEQLTNLKKENFNLKLRIYFLEERMGTNFNLDKENVVKKNVELLVEVEGLRKELQEKHDLLCQAVKAMELEDEEHKKLVSEKEEMLTEYQNEIEVLKTQLLDLKPESGFLSPKSYRSDPADSLMSQVISMQHESTSSVLKDLQEKINTLQEELNQEKNQNAAVQIILDQADSKIKNLMIELEQANEKLSSSEDDLRKTSFRLEETKAKCQNLQAKLEEKSQRIDEISSENDQMRKRQALLAADLEKERKRYERLKASSDQKTADLQGKLEASLGELKKSQELVVSESPARRTGCTDADSFSVQKSAASPRSPPKDAFLRATAVLSPPVISPASSPSPSVNFSIDDVDDLKRCVEQLKGDRDVQQQKIVKLKAEQMKACKIIKNMIDARSKTNEEIGALKGRIQELERELEGVVSKPSARGADGAENSDLRKENSMDEQSGDLIEHYKALTDELEEKTRILMETLNEKDTQAKMIQQQYEQIVKTNREKEERIVDLEFELLTTKQGRNSKSGEEDANFYEKQLREKDEEIERLNAKLQKRNCDLQGLVNNELWEKNREIEKLQKKQATKLIEGKDREIEKLQTDLKAKEDQLKIIKEKISELGIEIDLQSGDVSVENSLQAELERSEKLRSEANEMCSVLSRRLEELAIFLDSLLKQRSVLGFLGHRENKRLREIIDQSLDLSRSFTMSMMINPEQSLMQLTNLTSLLNDTEAKLEEDEEEGSARLSLVPGNASLTYRSHLYKKEHEDNSQIIQTLRQQIVNLKYELQLRDVELNKINSECPNLTEISSEKEEDVGQRSTLNTTSTTLKYKSDNQSESEAWSEPDRSVSRARIGLDGSPRSSRKPPNSSTESTEDEGTRSSKTPSKKCVLTESRNTIVELHKQVCDLNQKLKDKEMANVKLKQELENLEIKLEDAEAKSVEAEDRKIEAEARVEILENEKIVLMDSIDRKDKESQDKINEIEVEKGEALRVAEEAGEAAASARNEAAMAAAKLRSIRAEMEAGFERDLTEKIRRVEEESSRKIEQIQKGAEAEIRTLRETIEQLQLECANNYAAKRAVEDAANEIDRLKAETEALEEKIDALTCEERSSRKRISEYEEKINCLRNDLDNATLQYSEAVLEKTKMANEKAYVEQELSRSILKEVDTKKRLDEVESELAALRQSHQRQRSRLEVRVSELESANAELHNRLVKIQAGCGDHLSVSLPSTPNFVNQIVSFRRQHSENSSFLSEEQALLEEMRVQGGRSFGRLMPNQNIDIERHEANSSPDLGIESDHGRFSSLETHLNVQRPLLQTLELTESMSNLLDAENNRIQEVDCGDAHCCQKTLEMAHENSDLKRKLLRTRRALEETVTQLTLANQRKKQVEKTICKQIHKTSQVLRKAKANLDSGSETDAYRK